MHAIKVEKYILFVVRTEVMGITGRYVYTTQLVIVKWVMSSSHFRKASLEDTNSLKVETVS